MNQLSFKLSATPSSHALAIARSTDKFFLDELEELEASIAATKDGIRFRTPAAPVIGLNSENQAKYAAVGLSRQVPVGIGGTEDDMEPEYSEEESDELDAYDVLDDSTSSPAGV